MKKEASPLNPTQLRYFEILYDKQALGEAARAIPLSHQGLKKSMIGLERELGVRLFTRSERNRLVPTPAADILFSYTQRIKGERIQLDAELARLKSARSLISLASAQGVLGYLGFDFLRNFRELRPEIVVTEHELPDDLCDEALEQGRCDLGLTVAPQKAGLHSTGLCSRERKVWMRADDPLATRQELSLEDLAGRSMAVMGNGYKIFRQLDDLLKTHQVNVKLEGASEMMWMVRYVREEGNLALMSSHVSEASPGSADDIASVPLPGIPWAFGITWHESHELSEDEAAFVAYALGYVAG